MIEDPHVIVVTAATPELPGVVGPFASAAAARRWQTAWADANADSRGVVGDAIWRVERLWAADDPVLGVDTDGLHR